MAQMRKQVRKEVWCTANKNNQYLYTGPHSLIYNLNSQKFQELRDVFCDAFMGKRDLLQEYLESLLH